MPLLWWSFRSIFLTFKQKEVIKIDNKEVLTMPRPVLNYVYKFDELSESAKQKAIDDYREIGIDVFINCILFHGI